jgi:hypothetical protein
VFGTDRRRMIGNPATNNCLSLCIHSGVFDICVTLGQDAVG